MFKNVFEPAFREGIINSYREFENNEKEKIY